jgi:type II secretory pathway component PulF
MAQGFAMARWGRAFAAMYKAGVPYGEGVQMAADACGNEALRARMYPAVKQIQEGRSFTEVFAETGAFSPIVLDMTRTGETTGNLDEMLNKASEYYEDEGQTNARKAATILGVVALIFVGIYVGYIAVQFYSGMGFAGQYKEALEPPEN